MPPYPPRVGRWGCDGGMEEEEESLGSDETSLRGLGGPS